MTQTGSYIRDNIVKVTDSKGNFRGTAFFIKEEYCVTCHHCICEIGDSIIIERSNEKCATEWIEEYSDMCKDIAILRVKNSNFKPLECAKEAFPQLPISIWGFYPEILEIFPMVNR